MKFSQVRRSIKDIIVNLLYFIYIRKNKKGSSILITITDGIGDTVIRKSILEDLFKKYKDKEIYILALNKNTPLLNEFGVGNIILYSKDIKKKIIPQVKFLKKLSNLGIGEIISLEFNNENKFARFFTDCKTFGFSNKGTSSYYKDVVFFQKGHISNSIKEQYLGYFKKPLEESRVLPYIKGEVDKRYEDFIVIGVGGNTNYKRVAPLAWSRYIKYIIDELGLKVAILGYGDIDKGISDRIKAQFKDDERVIDLVGKTTFKETFNIIASSRGYLGNDSGLYNTASLMRKGVVAFFNEEAPFDHTNHLENVIVLKGDMDMDPSLPVKDNYCGTSELNNISLDSFKKAINEVIPK